MNIKDIEAMRVLKTEWDTLKQLHRNLEPKGHILGLEEHGYLEVPMSVLTVDVRKELQAVTQSRLDVIQTKLVLFGVTEFGP